MNITIVEDDDILSSNISKKISRSWYKTEVFSSVLDFKANNLLLSNLYIIDIWLPDWSWLDIVKYLRNKKNISAPILIMSCLWTVQDKVLWLNFGADDYIIKPFSPDEFIARIRALLRRSLKISSNINLKHNNISYNILDKEVFLDWIILHLPNKEKLILELFLLNRWEIITKSRLIDVVWCDDFVWVSENTINATLSKLRKKLWKSFLLRTCINEGYILK